MRDRAVLLSLVVCVGFVSITSAAQTKAPDVTGNWTGKFTATQDGKTSEESAYAVLKQTGSAITGSVGPRADRQQEITTGKIDTKDGVTTVAFASGRPGHMLTFELKLVDGHLVGGVKDEFYPANRITAAFERAK